MARSKILLVALAAAALPAVAMAQDVPDTDAPEGREVRTESRIPITVIGAIRDTRTTTRAEAPADSSVPELPVVYEEATPGQ